MRHTRTGWWLEEAGEVTPQPPLSGDTLADVVVVGGLPLFWTLLVPIAVAAVVACSIALARRGTAPA